MQPIARRTVTIQYHLAWCTADWPPPPRPQMRLSETVTMLATDNHGRLITTIALYSYVTHRWLVPSLATPLYWQQKERP